MNRSRTGRQGRSAPHSHAATARPGITPRPPRPTGAEIALAAVDPDVRDAIEAMFIDAGDTAGLTKFGLAVMDVQRESAAEAPAVAPARPTVRATPADVARYMRGANGNAQAAARILKWAGAA